MVIDEAAIRLALAEVADPEIPAISVVDLGMVERVDLADGVIRVELLPTFVGCPAVDMIKTAVAARLEQFGRPVLVEIACDDRGSLGAEYGDQPRLGETRDRRLGQHRDGNRIIRHSRSAAPAVHRQVHLSKKVPARRVER